MSVRSFLRTYASNWLWQYYPFNASNPCRLYIWR